MNDRLDVLRESLARDTRDFRAAEAELRALVAAHGDAALLVSDETLAALGDPHLTSDPARAVPSLHLSLLRG